MFVSVILAIASTLLAAPDSAFPPHFIAHTVDGQDRAGVLLRLGSDWSVDLIGDAQGPIAGKDLVALQRSGLSLPAYPTDEQIVLANGDCLPGHVLNVRGERLQIQAFKVGGPAMTVPLSAVSVMYFAAPHAEQSPALFLRRLTHEARRQDTVFLRNGDVLNGVLLGFDRMAGARLRVTRKDQVIAFSKIAAVGLNTRLTRLRLPAGPYGHLVLADGTRLGLAHATADTSRLRGTTLFGTPIDVPVTDIRALVSYHGPAVYLSELRPSSYQFRSYLGTDRVDYSVDGSILAGAPFGGNLVIDDNCYDRGLGMAGASRLQYALDGHYRWFEANVGLDKTGADGRGQIKVLVDGRPIALGWDGKLTGQEKAHFLRLNVAGARTLTLVVEFGDGGNVRERIDWAEARLLR
jgi:hypothetical protein